MMRKTQGWAAMAVALAAAVSAPGTPIAASPPHPHVRTLAGPAGSGWPADWTRMAHTMTASCQVAGSSRVAVVGDSITVAGGPRLSSQLSLLGVTSCIEAWSGRPTAPSVTAAAALPATAGARVLVFATGSNDIFDPEDFPAAVSAALKLAHGRPVVWVNAYVHRFHVSSTMRSHDLINSRTVDAVLARAAATHRNLHVVDWYGFVGGTAAREQLLLRDGVHTTDTGLRARTVLIVRAVKSALGL